MWVLEDFTNVLVGLAFKVKDQNMMQTLNLINFLTPRPDGPRVRVHT